MVSQTFLKVYLKFKPWNLSLGQGVLQKDFHFIVIYSYFKNVKVNVIFLKKKFSLTQHRISWKRASSEKVYVSDEQLAITLIVD